MSGFVELKTDQADKKRYNPAPLREPAGLRNRVGDSMIEFFMTFLVFLFVIVIMAVGVMRGRPPIAGSCGGLGAMGVDGACEICGGNPDKCEAVEQNSKTPIIVNALKA